jgi:hypothetical protein
MIYDSTPPKSIMDPFRRAVNDHIQEREREREELNKKRYVCPHDGEIRVEEWSRIPTSEGMKVDRYMCYCELCGQSRFVEA